MQKSVDEQLRNSPFSSIEGGQEYLAMLSDAIAEAQQEAAGLIAEQAPDSTRQLEALRLVCYKLEKLDHHIKVSRRLLNDLRTMRRLLLHERSRSIPGPRPATNKASSI